jgi:4'-phosphopantetheinyl transferase
MNQCLFQTLDSEIHVWWSMLDQHQHDVNNYYKMLSHKEQKRVSQFRSQLLRDRQIVSRGILKQLISKYISTDPEEIEFTYNKYGKPLLCGKFDKINLFFSISHSEEVGMFAFAKGNAIGVDVERFQELFVDLEGVIKLCFSDFEKSWFTDVSPKMKNEVFYKIWTAKEAFIKAMGTGLSFPLTNISYKLNKDNDLSFHSISNYCKDMRKWEIVTFNLQSDFIASLVTESNGLKLKKFCWETNCL